MEMPSATTRTLAEVNCQLCDVDINNARAYQSAPACPDVHIQRGYPLSIDSSTIPVRSPTNAYPSSFINGDGQQNQPSNLQTIAKSLTEKLTSIFAPQPAHSATDTRPPALAWHPKIPLLATVDTASENIQIFSFQDKIPFLGHTQSSLPSPLPAPTTVLNHELQRGARGGGALAWRPSGGASLAVGCADGVCLWHISNPSAPSLLWLQSPAKNSPITSLSWHPRGHLLAGASPTHSGFFVWNVATGGVTVLRAGRLEGVAMLRWSPCGAYLLAGGIDGSFRIWETTAAWKSAKWTVMPGAGVLVGAEWAPDGRTLVLAHAHQVTALHLTAEVPSLRAQVLPVPLAEVAVGPQAQVVERIAWDPRGQRLALVLKNKNRMNDESPSPSSSSVVVALYDTRSDPILTARFIGYARIGSISGSGAARDDGDWELVAEEIEIEAEGEGEDIVRAVVEEQRERSKEEGGVAVAYMPGFAQGAVLSVRKGDFIGTVPLYFSV